jgi:hypothetical protein
VRVPEREPMHHLCLETAGLQVLPLRTQNQRSRNPPVHCHGRVSWVEERPGDLGAEFSKIVSLSQGDGEGGKEAKRNSGRRLVAPELVSYVAVLGNACNERSVLGVFVVAFALVPFDLVASSGYGFPFVAGEVAVL